MEERIKRREGGGVLCFGRKLGKGRYKLERREGRREWVRRKGRGKGIRRGKGWALKPCGASTDFSGQSRESL